MEINAQTLKRVGFRKKSKSPNDFVVDVEIAKQNYISITISKIENEFHFSGLEVEGAIANDVRKKELIKFSMEEIMDFLNRY